MIKNAKERKIDTCTLYYDVNDTSLPVTYHHGHDGSTRRDQDGGVADVGGIHGHHVNGRCQHQGNWGRDI